MKYHIYICSNTKAKEKFQRQKSTIVDLSTFHPLLSFDNVQKRGRGCYSFTVRCWPLTLRGLSKL